MFGFRKRNIKVNSEQLSKLAGMIRDQKEKEDSTSDKYKAICKESNEPFGIVVMKSSLPKYVIGYLTIDSDIVSCVALPDKTSLLINRDEFLYYQEIK